VRSHGKERSVKATVRQIYGFSGHADRTGLLKWSGHFNSPPQQVFLTHGDEESAEALAATLRTERSWNVAIPHYQSVYDIS
jgi:metallo-beta-lactamase family protein